MTSTAGIRRRRVAAHGRFAVGGAIDANGQVIEIRATTAGEQPPIDLRYRVSDYLGRPRWGVTAIFSKLPMSPLLGLARNLGLSIPEDLRFDGTAQGAVGYSVPEGIPRMDGEVRIADSMLAVAGTPPLKVPGADLQFAGSSITLAPAAITNVGNETATLEASYDTASQKLEGVAIERRHVDRLVAPPNVRSGCTVVEPGDGGCVERKPPLFQSASSLVRRSPVEERGYPF